MERIHHSAPRPGWRNQVVQDGLTYYKGLNEESEPVDYWREDAHYVISQAEYESLRDAASTLWQMCSDAVEVMLGHPEQTAREFGIPEWAMPEVIRSWHDDDPQIYGRFDFRFGGTDEMVAADPSLRTVKLLEFNADTPTSLVESSITQHNWSKQAKHSGKDQWNYLHEALAAAWQRNMEVLGRKLGYPVETIHFIHTSEEKSGEDYMNTVYMASTAEEAGYRTKVFYSEHLRTVVMHDGSIHYMDPDGEYIQVIFKLYPWEWLTWFKNIGGTDTSPLLRNAATWIEPPWKMLWSNKVLLVKLWELYGDDPVRREFLLPAFFVNPDGSKRHNMSSFVRKPKLGREGANIEIYHTGELLEYTDGRYGKEGYMDQAFAPLPNFHNPFTDEDNYALMGVWMIDGEPQGLGIRESRGRITGNTSNFVPNVASSILYDA